MLDYSGRNPRQEVGDLQELADSIKEYGILEPIVVRPKADRFEIVAGERRFKAGLIAGLKEVPSIVKNLSDMQADEIRLIENVQRQDLTDSEKGDAIYLLLENYSEKYASMKSIAYALRVSPGTVAGWCSKSRKLSSA
jgi:ParB/RepB/Spo0J family partition protein